MQRTVTLVQHTVILVQLFFLQREMGGRGVVGGCELAPTGNQGHHHKTTTEMQSVDLFHYLANKGHQRQVATHAQLGSAHPSGQRHMGTWAQ